MCYVQLLLLIICDVTSSSQRGVAIVFFIFSFRYHDDCDQLKELLYM